MRYPNNLDFAAITPLRGISKIMTKNPASTLGPRVLHRRKSATPIWNGALQKVGAFYN